MRLSVLTIEMFVASVAVCEINFRCTRFESLTLSIMVKKVDDLDNNCPFKRTLPSPISKQKLALLGPSVSRNTVVHFRDGRTDVRPARITQPNSVGS